MKYYKNVLNTIFVCRKLSARILKDIVEERSCWTCNPFETTAMKLEQDAREGR